MYLEPGCSVCFGETVCSNTFRVTLADADYHSQKSIVESLIWSLQPHGRTALQLIWRAKGSETIYIAKVGKHFSDFQGAHHFELLTLVRPCHRPSLHYYFGARCSFAYRGTLQTAGQSCILQEASEKNCESAVSLTLFLSYSSLNTTFLHNLNVRLKHSLCFSVKFQFPKYLQLNPKISMH